MDRMMMPATIRRLEGRTEPASQMCRGECLNGKRHHDVPAGERMAHLALRDDGGGWLRQPMNNGLADGDQFSRKTIVIPDFGDRG